MVATVWLAPATAIAVPARQQHRSIDVARTRVDVPSEWSQHRRRSRTEAHLGLSGYFDGFRNLVETLP
jgi:hypothetical protein